ncbi:MAG: serine hydrolase domain-containing protein, partial [Bacteroidota bacterium]
MKSIITVLAFLFITQIGLCTHQDFTKLDNFLQLLEENDRFFGSVAVARNGEIIYSKAIGYADLAAKQANTPSTKFRIGSITKTFTATLIMKAVEMNIISLDDTIDAYFPRIQNAEKITVRHLLNHRSGIKTFTDRDYLSWRTQPITASDLLDKIVSKGIDFEPNAK